MTRMFRKNPNLSRALAPTLATNLVRIVPDRTAKAVAWTLMVAACAVAHFEFMHLISPLAASVGF